MNAPARKISGVEEKALDVLVVEDDAGSRALMVTLLESNDCLVRATATAAAAHELALARVPDVVVSDLHLGGGTSGWILAQALRAEPRTRHVALIAVTGQVEPRMEVVRSFDAYLRKPVETGLLIDLIKQLCAIHRQERRRAHAAR